MEMKREEFKFMIDLHMHSKYSDDGEFSPSELVEICKKHHIQAMAIADHNSAAANEEGERAAKEAGILYIPAIEIDCMFRGGQYHMLGYGIDYKSPDFQAIEDNLRSQGLEASRKRIELTKKLGLVAEERELREVMKDSYWPELWMGEVFAAVLFNKPEYKDHPLLLPYREGGERSVNPMVNFQWDFYASGKPCYVETTFPSMEEVVAMIHKNGGIAVLAHPYANLKDKSDKEAEELLDGIIGLGIDGIECFSSYHTPELADYYYHKAKEAGIIATCGSDFHGKLKPAIEMGGAVFGTEMESETYWGQTLTQFKNILTI